MNQRCSMCGQADLRLGVVDERLTVAGRQFEAQLDALVCPACGESLIDGATLQRFEREAALVLASGVPSGAAFTFLRKTLPITRAGLADLLQVPFDTVKAWETSARPVDLTAWVLVCRMVQERSQGSTATRDQLASFGPQRAAVEMPPTKLGRLEVEQPTV